MGGLAFTLLAVVVSTLMDGNSFGALIGTSPLVLVLFGSLVGTMMGTKMSELAAVPGAAIIR